jgi:hypothetical protein
MKNLKIRYKELEMNVHATLLGMINQSNYTSQFVHLAKAIKVSLYDYVELAFVDDALTFIDKYGYQYSVFNNDVQLEDLIDIIEHSKTN